ncbi:peptide-methionine (S)-S-oxide reductase MsrA [Christensenella timonensis]|uniref:peptide-methionine (S)-S-oxide reductase MsrA n=1 Tax=Christensenella timonensis TaxID=1816678 RepID=UPI0008306A24|nr:peptide-methionine (S)-S-oxide reductase MsrA [Christensenella timonensis]
MKEIYLAGGCFWGLQKYFDCVMGVLETQTGYVNGRTENPSYMQVCCGDTGFAEGIRLRYDEKKLGLTDILHLFFHVVDPTTRNRQGNDVGEQYRTGIYYLDGADGEVIRAYAKREQEKYEEPIVTEITPLKNYYTAEEYHQKYLDKYPMGYCHIGKEAFNYAGTYQPEYAGV